jgi:hypothetical protein
MVRAVQFKAAEGLAEKVAMDMESKRQEFRNG